MSTLIDELKRRNVFKVGVAYLVVGWLVVQVAGTIAPMMSLPEAAPRYILFMLIVLFPIALFMAWIFDIKPTGGEEEAKSTTLKSLAPLLISIIVLGGISYSLLWNDEGDEVASPLEQVQDETADLSVDDGLISLAVLPFVNMSSDKEQEYFSDGISEELLNVFVKIDNFKVASRTSAFAFKGKDRNIQEIAKILNVDHVLEGSVRRSGTTIRITAQLIDAATDKHIWSETYDREFKDVFKVQDEIANKIMTALSAKLGIETEAITVAEITSNMGAYDLYLQALAAGRMFSLDGELLRIKLLRQALKLDPTFVDALLLLSTRLNFLPTWDATLDHVAYTNEAAVFANRALTLAPENAGVHLTLAGIAARSNQYEEMERHKQIAISLDPASKSGALHLVFDIGYLSRAKDLINPALKFNPSPGWVYLIKALAEEGLGDRVAARKSLRDVFYNGYLGSAEMMAIEDARLAGDRVTWGILYAMFIREEAFGLEPLHLINEIEAITFADDQDKDRLIARFWMVARDKGYTRDDILKPYRYTSLIALKEYAYLADEFWGPETMQWMWMNQIKPFRKSEPFRSKVRSSGMLAYWQKHGWPDLCRAKGDNDFVCD